MAVNKLHFISFAKLKLFSLTLKSSINNDITINIHKTLVKHHFILPLKETQFNKFHFAIYTKIMSLVLSKRNERRTRLVSKKKLVNENEHIIGAVSWLFVLENTFNANRSREKEVHY